MIARVVASPPDPGVLVRALVRALAGAATAAMLSCGADAGTAAGGAPEDGAAQAAACVDAPDVTWTTFAEGFFVSRCQACHASGAPDRHGAPDSVVFDGESDARASADRIWARVLDAPSMPPAGGLTADERALLEVWLRCAND